MLTGRLRQPLQAQTWRRVRGLTSMRDSKSQAGRPGVGKRQGCCSAKAVAQPMMLSHTFQPSWKLPCSTGASNRSHFRSQVKALLAFASARNKRSLPAAFALPG